MPADIFAPGTLEVYVAFRPNPNNFYYLGTATSSPKVSAALIYKPVGSDRTDPGPHNQMLCSEQHMVTMVLNRLNHRTYNRLRDVGNGLGVGADWVRKVTPGRWIIGAYDVALFIRYALASDIDGPDNPDAASEGRLYKSAVLRNYEEDYPLRVQEVGLVFECNPLPKDGDLTLFTENSADFPTVTPE